MIRLLDPRTKLLIAFFFTILVVASRTVFWLTAEWGVLLALVLLMGKGAAYLRWLTEDLALSVSGTVLGAKASMVKLIAVPIWLMMRMGTRPLISDSRPR